MKDLPEKKQFYRAFYFPTLFVLILGFVKLLEIIYGTSFAEYGIYPRKINNLSGILFAPLIHADFTHLFNNAIPLFVLSTTVFHFYRKIAFQIIALIWLITGLCVWIGGREAFHIGASGVIYGLAAFVFFSGVIRKEIKLLTISLLVIFLYGSMVWGIFPFFPDVSWESHLFGALTGTFLAFVYKNEGRPKPEEFNDDDEPGGYPYWEIEADQDEIQRL